MTVLEVLGFLCFFLVFEEFLWVFMYSLLLALEVFFYLCYCVFFGERVFLSFGKFSVFFLGEEVFEVLRRFGVWEVLVGFFFLERRREAERERRLFFGEGEREERGRSFFGFVFWWVLFFCGFWNFFWRRRLGVFGFCFFVFFGGLGVFLRGF